MGKLVQYVLKEYNVFSHMENDLTASIHRGYSASRDHIVATEWEYNTNSQNIGTNFSGFKFLLGYMIRRQLMEDDQRKIHRVGQYLSNAKIALRLVRRFSPGENDHIVYGSSDTIDIYKNEYKRLINEG